MLNNNTNWKKLRSLKNNEELWKSINIELHKILRIYFYARQEKLCRIKHIMIMTAGVGSDASQRIFLLNSWPHLY